MAKYKHTEETMTVLLDLKNRIEQLIEVNNLYKEKNFEVVYEQNVALNSVIGLIDQLIDNGKINRGNEYFPDPIEPYITNKFTGKQLA